MPEQKVCLVTGVGPGTGKAIVERFVAGGYAVAMLARNTERLASIEKDLEGAHAFPCTAGSGGSTGGDKTLLVDLYGAIRSIDESEERGLDHFVMVSAMRVEQPLKAPPAMRHYMVAKLLADQRLVESRVLATVLRPGRLTDAAGSGLVRTRAADGEGFDISRENVADCILEALRQPPSVNRVVDLLDGETPIADVFTEC